MDFEISIEQPHDQSTSNGQQRIIQDTYVQSQYHALQLSKQKLNEIQILQKTQGLLKTEGLLLEYEQKRKNEKLKQIEYVYTNSFNSFLWEKNRKKGSSPLLIINRKDVLQIDEQLPDELEIFTKYLANMKMDQIFSIDTKPNPIFLRDFYNFFSQWPRHISTIIKMQINNATEIENAFESQYTFPSKVLSSLKYSSSIQLFCNQIFLKPLKEFLNIRDELSLDFTHIYQPLYQKIANSQQKGPFSSLYRFVIKGESQHKLQKKLKQQISELTGVKMSQAEKLIGEMAHFSINKQGISYLFSEIGSQQIDQQSINIKLAVLVWKKIIENRKKIQSILTSFINEILKNYNIIPKEIKYILKQYYQAAKKKFGEVKYQDVKSFFNKVVYCQLLLPQFTRLSDQQSCVPVHIRNFNISIIALFSQKILYGQSFYEKQKYTYFNQIISYYAKPIKDFIDNFIEDIKESSKQILERPISPVLLSIESIKFLYESMRAASFIPQLQQVRSKVCTQKQFQIGSTKFKSKDVYIVVVNKIEVNYLQILNPKDKVKRILIKFLTAIDQIPNFSTFQMLIEQYKYALPNKESSSLEIHANFLSLAKNEINIFQLCQEIKNDIFRTKEQCQRIKTQLEKEFNLAENMQKVYMKKLKEKQRFNAMMCIKDFINSLLETPSGFYYSIVDRKVCEATPAGASNSLNKCLNDIAEYYTQNYEGFDGLYHQLMEKINEQIEGQGIVEEETVNSGRQIIGCKLYEILKIQSSFSQMDMKIYDQMLKHSFINLKLLDLPQYTNEQDLILQESLQVLSKLKTPQSPNQLLKIFHQCTVIFQNVILITGKPSDITADVQIPMMIFILIKSKVKNISSLVRFIEKFAGDQVHSSILGQTLTLINSVTYLISEINAKQLNLSNQQYERLCSQQMKRLKSEADRQYIIIDQ